MSFSRLFFSVQIQKTCTSIQEYVKSIDGRLKNQQKSDLEETSCDYFRTLQTKLPLGTSESINSFSEEIKEEKLKSIFVSIKIILMQIFL